MVTTRKSTDYEDRIIDLDIFYDSDSTSLNVPHKQARTNAIL
jgi:7,8-dihydro-6-hydroxymethylpterin-pyrophosphokinase